MLRFENSKKVTKACEVLTEMFVNKAIDALIVNKSEPNDETV